MFARVLLISHGRIASDVDCASLLLMRSAL
jgi:hypothetical protein